MMNNNHAKSELTIWNRLILFFAFSFSIIGITIICVFLYELRSSYKIGGDGLILLEQTGQVGDFIGGLAGSIWAFAGVLLFYTAFNLQRKEFKLQRIELELHREELKSQRTEYKLNRITNIIYKQIEIIDKKAIRLILKPPSHSIRNSTPKASGIVSLSSYIYIASQLINSKTNEISAKQKRTLLMLIEFPHDKHFQGFVHGLVASLSMLTLSIKQLEKQTNNLESGDISTLFTLLRTNFHLDQMRNYLKWEDDIFRFWRETSEINDDDKDSIYFGSQNKMNPTLIKLIEEINSRSIQSPQHSYYVIID